VGVETRAKYEWGALCLAFACLALPTKGSAQIAASAPTCRVAGAIRANGLALPGVAVVAVAPDGAEVAASSTDMDGSYVLTLPGPGAYSVKASLSGFADSVQEVVATAEDCARPLDIALTLKSRVPSPVPTAPAPERASSHPGPRAPPTRAAPANRFQDVNVVAGGPEEEGDGAATAAESATLAPLPPGFSADAPTDSVTTTGSAVEVADTSFFRDRMDALDAVGGDMDALARRLTTGGGDGGFGGGMGGGFGRGFGGGFMGGGGEMRGRGDRLQASIFHTIGGAALDARPYTLNGRATEKADYVQHRFGATVSGPVKIPGVYDSAGRTSFTLGYSGGRSRSPYDAYSTVPTAAERAGDLSARGRIIYDPRTGQPFPTAAIPESRIDPAARALLAYVPMPNQPGDTQNFHYVTAIDNRNDEVSLRLNHRFGEARRRPGGGAGGGDNRPPAGGTTTVGRRTGPRTGGRGAGGGRGGDRVVGRRPPTLSVSLTYRRSSNDDSTSFPTVGGRSSGSSWSVPVSLSFGVGRYFHQTRVTYNRDRRDGRNLYAFTRDVAGEAGIGGVADDPFDWGVPNLSFTTFADLRDRTPSSRVDRRLQLSHSVNRTWRRHTLRGGLDYRGQGLDSQTDTNARGSFVFTGLYTAASGDGRATPGTGLDFADFLLGLPQQASVQYGPGRIRFRSHTWSAYVQDDWRLRGNLTLNLGLRYEYVSPFEEASDHLVNLDVAPGFTAAAPVQAGEIGPFSGRFPESLVQGDHDNVAPRLGIAWKPHRRWSLRAGYGINYNLGAYASIAQRLAAQPPFAVSNTSLGTTTAPLTFTSPFLVVSDATTTNSYGIDKHYQIGAVQVWNVDVQRELGGSWNTAVSYTGTGGWDLDIQRAPNRGPQGLRIPDVQPFLWQSSEGRSITHAISLRVRRRMARGFGIGASYTFAKSLDNASSIGGGGATVAQNDLDLDAERGRSSFDRRHRLVADSTWELPFGPSRRWLQKGLGAALLGGWSWNGFLTLESGAPFTARVRGDFADVARGVNGTLRADYTGGPIALSDPTTERWFNTDAFLRPPVGAFGNAGRNTITGPGVFLLNMGLGKNVPLGRQRSVQIRIQANNVLNTPQFGAIDTVVNSPTFGQVTSVRPMRSVSIQTRLRF
jgi:trimeric autotransporter adhesin